VRPNVTANPDAWVNQYKTTYDVVPTGRIEAARQRPRTLRTGASDFWDQLGPTAAIKKTTRHSDTPQVDTPHPGAWSFPSIMYGPISSTYRTSTAFSSTPIRYAINAAKAMQRAYDDEVISAFDGTAKSGVAGATSITFANDWPTTRGAAQGDEDFSAAALTVPNLTTIKLDLDQNDVDDDGRYIIMSPAGFTQLLKASSAPQITNADYATVKALVAGQIDTFLGFKFIRSTRLPSPSANLRYGFAWHINSMARLGGHGHGYPRHRTRRQGLFHASVLRYEHGSTRVQGPGVVRFKLMRQSK